MTDQSNAAAERSAHVERGAARRIPGDSFLVEVAPGVVQLKAVAEAIRERDEARAEAARLRDAGAAVLDYLLLPEWLNKPGGDSDVWAIRKSDLRALCAALAAKEPGHD